VELVAFKVSRLPPRYTALHAVDGGVSSLTADQIADVIQFDLHRRLTHARRIDLGDLASRLVVAGLPRATGGSRKDLMNEFIQAIMQPDTDGAVDHENLEQRLQAVVRKFQHVGTAHRCPAGRRSGRADTRLTREPHRNPGVRTE
jgi:hypothetical protein